MVVAHGGDWITPLCEGPRRLAAGTMIAAYLLDEADVATGAFRLDLRAVDFVENADVVLVTALPRRLAIRGLSSTSATPPRGPGRGRRG